MVLKAIVLVWALLIAAPAVPVLAHSPLFMCYFEGGGDTVLCEGGYSDGSCASCTPIYVVDADSGDIVACGMLDKYGFYEFDRPGGEFLVLFDGGEGHQVELHSSDIQE